MKFFNKRTNRPIRLASNLFDPVLVFSCIGIIVWLETIVISHYLNQMLITVLTLLNLDLVFVYVWTVVSCPIFEDISSFTNKSRLLSGLFLSPLRKRVRNKGHYELTRNLCLMSILVLGILVSILTESAFLGIDP
jgi:hypothetical protein